MAHAARLHAHLHLARTRDRARRSSRPRPAASPTVATTPRTCSLMPANLRGDHVGVTTFGRHSAARARSRPPTSPSSPCACASPATPSRCAGAAPCAGALEQPRVDLGLALEHVEAGREQPAGVQRVGQRGLVDDRAARRVHEHRGRLHEREPAGVDQVVRVASPPGHVQRHDVGVARAARRGRRRSRARRCRSRAWWSTRMPKPAARARDRAPDAAVADDAERRRRARRGPRYCVIAPARASDRRAGRLRRRARGATRRGSTVNARSAVVSSSTPGVLHTAMPCSRRGAHVDVVVADRDVRDDAQPSTARARVDHVGVDLVGEQRHDRVALAPRARSSSSCEYGASSAFGPTSS